MKGKIILNGQISKRKRHTGLLELPHTVVESRSDTEGL